MRKILSLLFGLLAPLAALAQTGTFQTVLINGQGRPIAGATASVCQGAATTAATITSAGLVTLTMSLNPLTQGFAVGNSIITYGFTSTHDTIFNSSIANGIASPQTISAVTSTQIQYTIANYTGGAVTATSNGQAVQGGTLTCLPQAATYTDATASQTFTQPYTTDGRGNFGFFAGAGEYVIEYASEYKTVVPSYSVISLVGTPMNFAAITSGTNTNALTMGAGGVLAPAGINNGLVRANGLISTTVSGLPSATAATGQVYIVSDALNAGSCATGGGSGSGICWSNGTSWVWLGGGGGGTSPVGNVGDAQCKFNATTLEACAINDNGTDLTAKEPWIFAGPVPYTDCTYYGCRAMVSPDQTATITITSSSTTGTLNHNTDFIQGEGVTVYAGGNTSGLTTPTGGVAYAKGCTGSTTYTYYVVAEYNGNSGTSTLHALTAASSGFSISTACASLGYNTISITAASTTTNTLNGITSTTYTATNTATAGARVYITGMSNAWQNGVFVITSASGTAFTVRCDGCSTGTGTTGSASYESFVITHWTGQPNVLRYWIYRQETAGTALVGVTVGNEPTWRDNGIFHYGVAGNASLYWSVTHFLTGSGIPLNLPQTPPASATPGFFSTTIASITGTSITLAGAIPSGVTGGTILHDNTAPVLAAYAAAGASGSYGVELPGGIPSGAAYWFNSTLTIPSANNVLVVGGPVHIRQPWWVPNGNTYIIGQSGGFPTFGQSWDFDTSSRQSVQGESAGIFIFTNNNIHVDGIYFNVNGLNTESVVGDVAWTSGSTAGDASQEVFFDNDSFNQSGGVTAAMRIMGATTFNWKFYRCSWGAGNGSNAAVATDIPGALEMQSSTISGFNGDISIFTFKESFTEGSGFAFTMPLQGASGISYSAGFGSFTFQDVWSESLINPQFYINTSGNNPGGSPNNYAPNNMILTNVSGADGQPWGTPFIDANNSGIANFTTGGTAGLTGWTLNNVTGFGYNYSSLFSGPFGQLGWVYEGAIAGNVANPFYGIGAPFGQAIYAWAFKPVLGSIIPAPGSGCHIYFDTSAQTMNSKNSSAGQCMPSFGQGAQVTDSFAGSSLNSNWTILQGGFTVSSGNVKGTTSSAWNSATYTGLAFDPSAFGQYVYVTLTGGAGVSNLSAQIMNQGSYNLGYTCDYTSGGGLQLYSNLSSGSFASISGLTQAVGDVIYLYSNNTTVYCMVSNGGVQKGTTISGSVGANGNYTTGTPGFLIYSNAALSAGSFQAGDYSASPVPVYQPKAYPITANGCVFWAVVSNPSVLGSSTLPCTNTVANGTATLGTAAISSGACATVVTVTATGVLTTDNIAADFNADPTSTTGYTPGAMLTIIKYPTAGNVNFKVCNNTASSITPSAVTLNWRVVR